MLISVIFSVNIENIFYIIITTYTILNLLGCFYVCFVLNLSGDVLLNALLLL